MRGQVSCFIAYMELRSREAETGGVRKLYECLANLGVRHKNRYGEKEVEGLVEALFTLSRSPNFTANSQAIIKLQAQRLVEQALGR